MLNIIAAKHLLAGLAGYLLLTGAVQAQGSIDLSDIGTTCITSPLDDCRVLTAGFLNQNDYSENDGAPFLAWQTQTGSTEGDGVIGGFVLLHHGDGWSIIDSGFDGYFQQPRLNDDGVLHQPGYGQGTGVMNTDRVYQLDEDGMGFSKVDLDQWMQTIDDKLPPGLAIWKGVAYDFSSPWSGYVARTALWKDDDANCCPSGGTAVIGLEIKDHVLVTKDVVYTPPTDAQ